MTPRMTKTPQAEAAAPAGDQEPFWRTTPLEAMTPAQWESLCDGCGRCCLVKLEDEDTGAIHATDVACRLFDAGTCRCKDYANRTSAVPDCVSLTPEAVRTLAWLPPTCGYRLVADGKDLPHWHPLVSGRAESVVEAGVSVRGRVHAGEDDVMLDELLSRIRRWPLAWPRRAKRKAP
jgi:uncharacterized cysteine cluster protein YcgN (CxxCxxCC family)